MRGEDFEPLTVKRVIVEREPGALMDCRIVVNNGDFPGRPRLLGRFRGGVVDQPDNVVVVGHRGSANEAMRLASENSSFGAATGSMIRKVVPRPAVDSSFNRPPRRLVTRL